MWLCRWGVKNLRVEDAVSKTGLKQGADRNVESRAHGMTVEERDAVATLQEHEGVEGCDSLSEQFQTVTFLHEATVDAGEQGGVMERETLPLLLYAMVQNGGDTLLQLVDTSLVASTNQGEERGDALCEPTEAQLFHLETLRDITG